MFSGYVLLLRYAGFVLTSHNSMISKFSFLMDETKQYACKVCLSIVLLVKGTRYVISDIWGCQKTRGVNL
ncbi:MAG: hypothetical protein ACI8RD_005899 [Bacillariaceae sp.]